MYRFKGFVLWLCLVVSPLSLADSHRDAAYQLLDSMEINQLMSETVDAMLAMQIKQNPSLKPYKQTMREFFSMYLSGESLREDFADMYSEAFTQQELLELSKFYDSELGKKTLSVQPMISAQGAALGEHRVRENIHVLERMIAQEAERIEKLQNQG